MSRDELFKKREPAVLALAEGSVFSGVSIGMPGETVGEVVFNTAMTGYQEILTDPSYAKQIVTLTYPHIGNVGVNENDTESHCAWVAGFIIREPSPIVSNWRARGSLEEYLKTQKIVAIAGIDTRRLTHLLREKGAQNGCIVTGEVDSQRAIEKACAFPGLQGMDLAKEVTTSRIIPWQQGTILLSLSNDKKMQKTVQGHHVVVYDFGVKYQILRMLVARNCRVTLVPAQTPAEDVLAMEPDGIVLSNGPGDPAACGYAIENIRVFLDKEVPLFGICLGFQLLALACGGKTVKMKFGHHGANHPVKDLETQRVMITSQNHGFDVEEKNLPPELCVTHISLFDGSLQGIAHRSKPAFAFQGHPEASPGPHDIDVLFDKFVNVIQSKAAAAPHA